NQPLSESDSSTLMDFQSDGQEEPVDAKLEHLEQLDILYQKINQIRETLNDKEKFLLESRLLSDEPLTLQEIGDKYGITREAVRQLEVRLISKLKKEMIGDESRD